MRRRGYGRPDRRRMQARAAAAVAVLLAIFAALQLALGLTIDGPAARLRDPLYYDKELKLAARVAERTAGGVRPFTVVMFGSSRTSYGLRGTDLEEILTERLGRPAVAFNLGLPAAGPITNLINLRRLLADGPTPDVVLLEVLPPLLAGQIAVPPEEAFLKSERLSRAEVELAVAHGFPADATRRRWHDARLAPWHGLRLPLLGRVVPRWLPWNLRFDFSRGTDPTGWSAQFKEDFTPDEYRQGVARSRNEYIGWIEGLELTGPAAAAVGEGLKLCRDHGVPAALVLMPEATDFRSWYPPPVLARLNQFLGGLTQTYGAPVIDARGWVADDGFSDGHHLLTTGATAFTARLGREAMPRLLPELR